jgi:hypothetical protein
MNIYPSFTTLRSSLAFKFDTLRICALRDSYLGKLTGKRSTLASFPEKEARLRFATSRKLIGIKNIRVAEIVGTLNRDTDFDSQFRPLKKQAMDRWVNAYILHEQDGWSPIIIHKLGDQYFVEDGHHRVSVARFIGMEFIEAKVWEYETQSKSADICHPTQCTKRSPSKVYATG